MAIQSEKSEMLMTYDQNMTPTGLRTREDVHKNELLHQTIRLWAVEHDRIWFQQRSQNKKLFPGRLDLAATGHIDPYENPTDAALRETREEIGLDLTSRDIEKAGSIPFPFMRPDGKLDNEFANIYLYQPAETPKFKASDEVAGFVCITTQDYDRLIRTGKPITGQTYQFDPNGQQPPVRTGTKNYGPDDFCCLNKQEWARVKRLLIEYPEAQKTLDFESTRDHTPKPKTRDPFQNRMYTRNMADMPEVETETDQGFEPDF